MSKLLEVCIALTILFIAGFVIVHASDDSCQVYYEKITKKATTAQKGEYVIDSTAVAKIPVALNLKPFTAQVCPGDTALLRATIAQLYYIAGVPKAKLDSVASANMRVKP